MLVAILIILLVLSGLTNLLCFAVINKLQSDIIELKNDAVVKMDTTPFVVKGFNTEPKVKTIDEMIAESKANSDAIAFYNARCNAHLQAIMDECDKILKILRGGEGEEKRTESKTDSSN